MSDKATFEEDNQGKVIETTGLYPLLVCSVIVAVFIVVILFEPIQRIYELISEYLNSF